jgi:hypothetical protein
MNYARVMSAWGFIIMIRAFKFLTGRAGLLIFAGLLAGGPVLRASELTFDLSNVFSGSSLNLATPPGSPAVEAIFQDVSPGVVRLTVSNLNLTGTENVAKLYFNLNPNLDPAQLRFQFEGGGGFVPPLAVTGGKAYLGPGLNFNVSLGFPNHGDSSRTFDGGEYLSELITGIPTLTAADFGTFVTRRSSPNKFYAVAEIDQIGVNSQAGWLSSDKPQTIVAVPEPGPHAMIAAMIGAWLAFWASARVRETTRSCQLRRIAVRRTASSGRRQL